MEKATQSVASGAPVHHHESVKETVESIVVALILAFVFRAFMIEAFVIPTGSMAPTLYGAHGTIVCEDCGWEFAYGLADQSEGKGGISVTSQSRAICPNCNHFNTNLEINDRARNAESGDRILVLKWPIDLGGSFFGPKRWDVSVFKNPTDGEQNYIKRLTGLPNEVLMVVDGDIYTVPTERLTESAVKALDQLRREKYLLQDNDGKRRGRFPPPPPAVLQELIEKMAIARKTPEAQESLWFIVYDHNHLPQSVDREQPLWSALAGDKSHWDTATRVLRYEGTEPDRDFVELKRKSIHASYAYNLSNSDGGERPPVGDQRVSFVLTPRAGDGVVRVRLAKGGRYFWASIFMDGRVKLIESANVPQDDTPIMAEERIPALVPGRSVKVSFENVDYRLALRVGEDEVVASSNDRTSPAYYGPDLGALLKMPRVPEALPPRLHAERATIEIAHLRVERDIYYYHATMHMGGTVIDGWGTAGSPILLRKGEYYMLGDNSPASQDSRLWSTIAGNHYLKSRGEDYQLGTVPEDQMIGKAFFVYWPSACRIGWLPMPKGWGIIPDVGRMRWIR